MNLMDKSSIGQKSFSRRNFLAIVAVSTAAGLLYRYGLPLRKTHLFTLRHTKAMMGTTVNFTLLGPDRDSCHAALSATISRMEHLGTILSRHSSTSSLAELNRTGEIISPDKELLKVFSLAREMSTITQGAFDVTVLPLLKLYKKSKHAGELPPQNEIEKVLSLVDYRQITLTDNKISYNRSAMEVTLDGIGKGYIVDEGVKKLQEMGFPNIYLEAGGDLMASGTKMNGEPWKIGIQSPRPQKSDKLVTLKLQDKALATSGDYRQAFTSDKRHHHIINPLTGFSPPELASSTITAPTVATADGLATASMVLGPQKSLSLLESLPNCDGFLIGKNLTTFTTTGFFG